MKTLLIIFLSFFSLSSFGQVYTRWQPVRGKFNYKDSLRFERNTDFRSSVKFTSTPRIGTDTVSTRAYSRSVSGINGVTIDTIHLSNRINLKAPITNPVFLGTIKLSSDTIATRAYSRTYGGSGGSKGSIDWGGITGILTQQTDLSDALTAKAPKANPVFTGVQKVGSDTLATKAYARLIIANKTNWNTAYGWGNHASAGYALSSALSGYVATSRTVNGHALTGNVTVTATDLSLGNVTNESKTTMFTNATLFGLVKISTTDTLATRSYSRSVGGVGGGGSSSWGLITGLLSNQSDLVTALGLKANSANASFTGTTTGITAAMVSAMATTHAANAITGTNITNWNSAYGWGNHASAGYVTGTPWTSVGYLTSQTSHADVVVDGDFTSNGILKRTAAGVYGIVTDNSANWNTAYGWGNPSGVYLPIAGTAARATVLATPRAINTINFDGSAAITIPSNIAAGTAGNVMTSTGSVWSSAAPAVTLTNTVTLTNKTLTSPKINENVALTVNSTGLNTLTGITAARELSAAIPLLTGVDIPQLSTSAINAISAPAEGKLVYDITLHVMKFWNGSVWKTLQTN